MEKERNQKVFGMKKTGVSTHGGSPGKVKKILCIGKSCGVQDKANTPSPCQTRTWASRK